MSNTRNSMLRLLAVLMAATFAAGAPAADDLTTTSTEMAPLQWKAADIATDEDIAKELELSDLVEPAAPTLAAANAANYAFATDTTASLVDMSTGTTTLVAPDQDDTASAIVPIGFDFYFQGDRQDRFSVNSNGLLRFGATTVSGTAYNPLAQAGQSLVTAYGADQRTHAGNGKVHFKLTGTAPNRVLVVEWLNMQSDFNSGGTVDLTYQVHLSETTGTIEFVYGSMSLSVSGAADANSLSPEFGFSSGSVVTSVGSITAAQSGTPAPSFSGAAATPVDNVYVAGSIPVLTSAADGVRRRFVLTPPVVGPPGGPLAFTSVNATTMTLNWGDSANEIGYTVFVSTDGANYSFVNTVAQNATNFVASGLIGSTTYFWRVYAVSEGDVAFIGGTQATIAPIANSSLGSGLWSNPGTWSTGIVPTSNDAVSIAGGTTVTIDTAAVSYSLSVSGTLQFEQTTARTLAVGTDAAINGGGAFQSNPAGTQTGHNFTLSGNLANNGTLDFSTNADTAGAILTLGGASNTTFSGTGATTDIRQITVNKGTTADPLVELLPANFTVRGVTTDTVVGGWLVMTNGTLKLSGTFAGTSRVFATAAYTIPATSGVWLNNPNYVVAAQNGNAVVNGRLRISQGIYNQGTLNTATMTGGAGAIYTIEGTAIVNLAGRFNPATAITYNQSGGTLNLATVGNSGSGTANGTFTIPATAVFNMTGGTINLVQASTGATPIDYINTSASIIASQGTLQTGTGATVTNLNFRLRGNVPNLVVDNTTNNKTATATAQVNLLGTTLVKPGATFVINGQICLVIGPTFTNNGTLTGTATSTRFYFLGGSGPTTYNGNGVVTAPLTSFEVDNVAGVTLDPAVNQVSAIRFNNFSGGLTNSSHLSIGNGGATTAVVQLGVAAATQVVNGFDVPPVFNPGTGGNNLLYAPELTGRTTGNEVPPLRTLNLLSITNTNPITIASGDIVVNGAAAGSLALGSARVITGPNALFFNSTVGTVTRTTGYVDGNFRKTFSVAASQTFEVGTANGYTPVIVNATAGTFPAPVTVAAVQTPAPGIQPLADVISRYWTLAATGVTADVTFSYLDPADLPGTVTEANLHVLRHETGNPSDYSDQGGTINTAANTATVTGVTTFSDFTLGEAVADLAISKTDGVTAVVAGGSLTYTITATNGGTVGNPAVVISDVLPASLTCATTCTGALGGTCTAGPVVGDISDTANIPSGGSVTYSAACAVDPGATGSISNTATIAGGAIVDPNAADNSATDVDVVGGAADLAITKTDGVTTATPGNSVTYTITASNAGPSSALGSTVVDTFPGSENCTWTCSGAVGGTCATPSGSGDINALVDLPAGGNTTFTASCSIAGDATGTLINTATVAPPGSVVDSTPANNSATDTDTLTPNADLSITKTDGVTTATAGGTVTYTIVASNSGPSSATGATVADTFPASETCTWTCAGVGGGTCAAAGSGNINGLVNLPSGGGAVYTASCSISAAATGTLSNTASVTAPGSVTDPTPGNNSATDSDTLASTADLSITKTDGVTTATAGSNVTYTIVANNAGPSNATGAIVADTFPASETCTWTCAGAGGGTCTAAGSGNIAGSVNLPSGGSVVYAAACSISASATGTLSNTATVTAPASTTDPTPGNNSATDTDTLGATADLSITKTDGVTSATPGGTVTYTIVATNPGPSNATAATVTDTFPASETCTWTCSGAGGGTCTASGSGNINGTVNLPSGGSTTYTASCSVSASATGTLSNTATVTAPAGVTDPTPGNNSATDTDTLSGSADLSITKTDGVTTATPGGSVTYTIAASNAGPSSATGATVADTFPASETCTWTCVGAGGGTCTAAGSGNINDTVNLPSGASTTYTASCSVSASATGTLSNTAIVTAPAGVTDPTPGNNSATDTDTLDASADLSITKTDGVSAVAAGDTTIYTIVASNAGPSSVTGANVADVFPSTETCTWTCAGAGGATCGTSGSGNIGDLANLPSGGSATYTATCAVSAAASGTVSNTATVTVPTGVTDTSPANNSATDTDTVAPIAKLNISKTDGLGFATIGDSVTYTIVAANTAGSTATGAHVIDNLPPELTAATWTCSGTAGGVCVATGAGSIDQLVTLPVGASVTFVLTATLDASAGDTLVNMATIDPPTGVTDPVLTDNTATDVDEVVIFRDGFDGDPVTLATLKVDAASLGAHTMDFQVRAEDRAVMQVIVSLRDDAGKEMARLLQLPVSDDLVQLLWLQRTEVGTWSVAASHAWPVGATARIEWKEMRDSPASRVRIVAPVMTAAE